MIEVEKIERLLSIRLQRIISNSSSGKDDIRTALILLRYLIRDALADYNKSSEQWCDYTRQKNRMGTQGITMPMLERQIAKQSESCRVCRRFLSACGRLLSELLALWEASGATRKDLLHLCNVRGLRDWEKQSMQKEANLSFAELIFVYNLDYQNKKDDSIHPEEDAPFTHAMKEYMLDTMLHTDIGREASRRALEDVFPEVWEKALTVHENEFGEKGLYDHEGNCVQEIG